MTVKILTVDDSKTIRMIVKKAFRPFDCELLEAENGVEGLAIAAKEKPDLIVLDITMPVMNGIEMLEKVKSESELQNIPVIMLTAESGKENVMQILKKGVQDYMVKPFKGEEIIARVEKIMSLEPKDEKDPEAEKATAYFSRFEGIAVLGIPAKVTRPVAVEVEGHLKTKIEEISDSQLNKMILNIGRVAETNVSLIKLVLTTIQRCQRAKIQLRVVATPKQSAELKELQETGDIPIANSLEAANASFV